MDRALPVGREAGLAEICLATMREGQGREASLHIGVRMAVHGDSQDTHGWAEAEAVGTVTHGES